MSGTEESLFNFPRNSNISGGKQKLSATSTPLQSPKQRDGDTLSLSPAGQFRSVSLNTSNKSKTKKPKNKALGDLTSSYMANLFTNKSTESQSSPPPKGLIIVSESSTGERSKNVKTSEIMLPKIEEFSFSSILSSVKQEGNSTLGSVFHVLDFYRGDLTMELHNVQTSQHAVMAQMSALDRLASSSLSTTQTRVSQARENVHNLKGVDQLANATEKAYHSISKIKQTLLEIEALLPPHERLGPDFSAHKRHYPKLHKILGEDRISNHHNAGLNFKESEDLMCSSETAITYTNRPSSSSLKSRSTSISSVSSLTPSIQAVSMPPSNFPSSDNRLKRTLPSKGYPRAMMGLRPGVPSTAVVRSTSITNLNAVYSDIQYPASMMSSSTMPAHALPIHEVDSTSTISRQSPKAFSIKSYISFWGGKANSEIEDADAIIESAEEKLRKLIGIQS
ncbi:hypothetical protein NADFUDRAFT_52767 [Nadsonia fulvescens var. elongata DSM 6958]|uniref:BLOC-1-related complex subunit 5 n=1 Tax=Nadsonia fulvescens var. elongata DSM 6958 TaxID=857566 RepID=A0A1E3PGB5_9ASCO|nr:hypothetical protein NADFUDRAFT_52767 [Nadsonia fulvescens var. elongata DSM 6958]